MRSVDAGTFETLRQAGAVVFDLRLPSSRKENLGLSYLDLAELQAGQMPDLAKDIPIYLLCERGQVSELAGLYLEAAGFSEVYNVRGGMIAWRARYGSEDEASQKRASNRGA